MKKVLKTLALTGSMLAVAAVAQAADTAQVTLTSPAITKQGCEAVGAVTLNFDKGTVLTEGDWMYMDLPTNTEICTTINYFIAQGIAGADELDTVKYPSTAITGTTDGLDLAAENVDLGTGGITGIVTANLGAGATYGPITNKIEQGGGAAILDGDLNGDGDVLDAGEGAGQSVVLRVYAPAGGRRLWVYVFGTTALADSISVPNVATNNSSMVLNLIDGQAYTDSIILNNSGTNTGGVAGLATVWGDVTTDIIGLNDGAPYAPAHNVPHPENTLCVDATQMSGDIMFVSFNSLNSFLTFTGDSQIAHTAAANSITLESCGGKTDFPTEGNILIGSQGGCLFDYEVTGIPGNAPNGYCTYNAVSNPFIGNKMLISGATTFGDPGDRYDMAISIDTAGVYFASNAVTIAGYVPTETMDTDCAQNIAGAAGWMTPTFNIGDSGVTAYDAAGTCSVTAGKRVQTLTTGSVGAITMIDTFDTLWVNYPNMVYDTAVIGNGTEVDISLSMSKYPCGSIIDATRTVGTFVTTCPVTTTSGTTLLYPFMVPFDGVSAGSWWGGFTIVNASTASGTCTMSMMEADGDTATYTTGTVAANGGQWNAGALADLLAMVTPGAANTGTFGDSNVSITASCTFNMAGGFAFIGNDYGVGEGTGYTAYVLDATAIWQ